MIIIEGPGNIANKKKAMNLVRPQGIWIAASVKNAFNVPRNHNYAVYNNGKFVGFALLSPENNKTLYLNVIVTEPGHGYGSALINRIKSNARKKNFKKINLNSVNEARKFYEKMGFKKSSNIRIPSRFSFTF